MPKVETVDTPERVEVDTQDKLPSILDPYVSLGLDLIWDGGNHASADCPWCGNDKGKFSINVESGLWRCWVCAEGSEGSGGNIYTFLNSLLAESVSSTSTKALEFLRDHRGFESIDTLRHWNVCLSRITGDWLVPGFNHESKLVNLYRYNQMRALFSTKGLNHGLFGTPHKIKEGPVYLCEGPWDALALWEILKAKEEEASVVAVPGCNVFEGVWYKVFSDRIVNILFDNDHPTDKMIEKNPNAEPGAFKGLKRVASILLASPKPPKEVNCLFWGDKGYDPKLKSGLDVRDILQRGIS
tara:strand:+ start:12147 stop:13040 length:894 start_codon:yes stop_codon:yes gene_type:complete